MKKLFVLLGIVAGITLFIFIITSAKDAKYKYYYSSKINGTIDTLHRWKHYVTIEIGNKEFIINPITSPLNNFNQFDAVAIKGDTLFKNGNSDTLLVINKGVKYFYTVQK